MDFNLSDEQRMLRDAASRFVREQYGFETRRRRAEAALAGPVESRGCWAQYADMGWLALTVPEAAGGLGCGFVETALLAEELGRGLVLEPYVACAVLAARLVETADAPEFAARREELLGSLAAGTRQVALAHHEPGSRFELEGLATQARPEGAGFVIEGVKLMVPAAETAADFIVSAHGDGGLDLFLVPRDAVVMRPYALIDGTRAADVELRGAYVPRDARLGTPGTARARLEEALDRAALAQVAEALGSMEAVLEITSEYLKTRQQFGQPIGKFQALQHRMAEMFVEVQETRSILYRGIAHLESSPALRRQAVSAAKVQLGSAARFVGGQGIQLHGGIGLTDEYPVGHYYKRLLVLEKMYGDSEWHLGRFVLARRDSD